MKSREVYDINSGKRRKVYSPLEELQYYSSIDRSSLSPDFIKGIGEQWEHTLTNGQKDFIKGQKDFQTFLKTNQGKYTHVIYEYGETYFPDLSNLDLTRLYILATYANSNGRCYDENRNEIKRSTLASIWDVNKNKIKETYDNLLDSGAIILTDKKQIVVNIELFKNGTINNSNTNGKTYTRMFNDKFLGLYHNTKKMSRKQVGMLIRLLPYINYRHNILCHNPEEFKREDVKPLNWRDVCNILNIDFDKNSKRVKNNLMNLKIDDYNTLVQIERGNSYTLIINPKVYYSGNNIEDIKYLYSVFNMPQADY